MDTLLTEFRSSMNEIRFESYDSNPISGCPSRSLVNGFDSNCDSFNNSLFNSSSQMSPMEGSAPSGSGSEGDTSPDEGEFSNTILKFISEILMEEDLGSKTCIVQDCLALQAAEKSFYDVLGQKYPPPPKEDHSCTIQNGENSGFDLNQGSIDQSSNVFGAASNLGKSSSTFYRGNFTTLNTGTPLVDAVIKGRFAAKSSSEGGFQALPSVHSGEVTNFVPKDHSNSVSSCESRTKKNHLRDDSGSSEDERSNKQSAVYGDADSDESEYDKALLCPEDPNYPDLDEANRILQHNGRSKGSKKRTSKGKKNNIKNGLVDLGTLLSHCAQAVASYDHRTANELLKQIRQHSSPSGDGTQRLAHYFADGLEARLAGTGKPIYSALVSNKVSAADILKGYMLFIEACPFRKMSNFFANRTIMKHAEKATKLHIIDFGIAYGFQWPCLIQRISKRPGGPPKIRITGIELPQAGFRPTERVEETGRRLENYCKRFNVPFEYNVIAKKWETISLEDLKIDRDEMTAVNCLYRLKYLPDETAVLDSPRDAVLKLIRKINPDLFFHGIVNGTYNAPFFATRFREALFHFSAVFDMFDATTSRDLPHRQLFEKEIFARDAINVIACEGLARVERPETYKQWQVRNRRAGFRQLPLDQELLKKVRAQVKVEYHQDFVIDQDGQWMLQGWKGRILYALSCWKPA